MVDFDNRTVAMGSRNLRPCNDSLVGLTSPDRMALKRATDAGHSGQQTNLLGYKHCRRFCRTFNPMYYPHTCQFVGLQLGYIRCNFGVMMAVGYL